ncbi:transposase [Micromonospora sp. NPDC023966]|uniref:transposase n=1 Tax=Micromonospora sp. NPDC023966 TaxID=3154699 RepID=UPI003402A9A2
MKAALIAGDPYPTRPSSATISTPGWALVQADADDDDKLTYLFLADSTTMGDDEHPLLAVDLYDEPGRTAGPDLPELHRLATTIETWWPQIHAFLHTGITNAGSEGINRVIKTVSRDAYGFRNPDNQRVRTRTATTRRHRGHLNPA